MLELLSKRVRENLSFLEDLNYQGPTVSVVGGAGVLYALKAEYDNLEAGRRLSVSFQAGEDGEHAGVSTWRLPIRTYREDLINFYLLVWERLPDFNQGRLNCRNYRGTLADRLDGFLEVHARLLQSEAADILNREAWEEGLYDY